MKPIEDWWLNALWSVSPTIILGLVFWFIFRAILRSDDAERRAFARVDKEERAKRAAQTRGGSTNPGSPLPTTEVSRKETP